MKKHIKYLANKHQGGISNSVGNLYENHFAVFKIISHFDKSKAFLNKIVFVNQKSGCFIDVCNCLFYSADNNYKITAKTILFKKAFDLSK